MTIEIRKTDHDSYYEEVVNIAGQYRKLVQDPKAQLKDGFKERIFYFGISFVVLAALLVISRALGSDILTIIAVAILALDIILSIFLQIRMKKTAEHMKADTRKTTLDLDGEGIAVTKDGKGSYRLNWNTIAALRIFEEAFCLITKTADTAPIIGNKDYAGQIAEFLKDNHINGITFIEA